MSVQEAAVAQKSDADVDTNVEDAPSANGVAHAR